ncbi:MAG: hypothetical protein L3J18_07080 [Candidatus Brocadia sp.]|uniref:Uncharacterized protein n=1 Tax=Candidatus Brocadia fulgida TaxID=380242 RepID=A0A0M2UYJ5_9BACT|nr:MAG: hypothetical protein BROFUL_00114 [Candidatus Brocadia fulgida]UJS22066.1 MAG: hypothetical protein L3J18_07080 [Candidatus Brocadia sp.]
MGVAPCTNGITVEFGCQFRVELTDSSLAGYFKGILQVTAGKGERVMRTINMRVNVSK